jgi:hypothetical protein
LREEDYQILVVVEELGRFKHIEILIKPYMALVRGLNISSIIGVWMKDLT